MAAMEKEVPSSGIRVCQMPRLEAQLVAENIASRRLISGIWQLPLIADDSTSETAYLLDRAGIVAEPGLPAEITRAGDALRFAFDLGAQTESKSHCAEVWAGKYDSFRWPAAIFAAIQGRHFRIIEDLEQAILDARRREVPSVTLFAPPAFISTSLVESVSDSASTPTFRFGVVTGRNEIDVWSWLLRRCLSAELYRDHCGMAVLATEQEREFFKSFNDFHTETDVDAEFLENLMCTPMDSLIFRFHSKESCGLFGPAILCGLPQKEPEVGFTTSLAAPGCAFGNKCLWKNKVRVLLRQINVSHLVAISCSSLRLSLNLIDLNYSVGLSVFGGRVRSYLAPMRFVFSNTLLPLYAYGLFRSNEYLGTIVSELNDFLKCTHSDLPCFLLLGDPEDRPRNDPIGPSQLNAFGPSANMSRLCPSSTSIANDCPELNVSGDLTNAEPSNFVLDNIAKFTRSGFFPDSAEATLNTVLNGDHAGEASLLELLSKLVNGWALRDSENSFWLSVAYRAPDPRHKTRISRACYVCGSGTRLHEIESQPGKWVRHVFVCPRCGIIADIPPSDIKFRFLSTEKLEPGECLSIRLSLEDLGGISVLAGGISVNHSRYFGWTDLPQTWSENVSNKKSCTWSFSLSVPKFFPPWVYHVRAFLLMDGIPWFLSRPLIVLNRKDRG